MLKIFFNFMVAAMFLMSCREAGTDVTVTSKLNNGNPVIAFNYESSLLSTDRQCLLVTIGLS